MFDISGDRRRLKALTVDRAGEGQADQEPRRSAAAAVRGAQALPNLHGRAPPKKVVATRSRQLTSSASDFQSSPDRHVSRSHLSLAAPCSGRAILQGLLGTGRNRSWVKLARRPAPRPLSL